MRCCMEGSDSVATLPVLQRQPGEAESQAAAAEVQRLLITGDRVGAMTAAVKGGLWGQVRC